MSARMPRKDLHVFSRVVDVIVRSDRAMNEHEVRECCVSRARVSSQWGKLRGDITVKLNIVKVNTAFYAEFFLLLANGHEYNYSEIIILKLSI